MLEGVISSGTGTAAQIGRPEAGKTGTGQDFQDAWFVGYVPQLCTGVWVGRAKAETPMPDVPGYGEGFGGILAAPIWHDFMLAATQGMPVERFAPAPIPLGAGEYPVTTPRQAAGPLPVSPHHDNGKGHGNGNGPPNGHRAGRRPR